MSEEDCNRLRRTQTEEKKDESGMFAEYIAEKLRKMKKRTRAILQHQIHNLIFQAEMDEQDQSVSTSMPSYSVQPQPIQFHSISDYNESPTIISDASVIKFSSPSPSFSCNTPSPPSSPREKPSISDSNLVLD